MGEMSVGSLRSLRMGEGGVNRRPAEAFFEDNLFAVSCCEFKTTSIDGFD